MFNFKGSMKYINSQNINKISEYISLQFSLPLSTITMLVLHRSFNSVASIAFFIAFIASLTFFWNKSLKESKHKFHEILIFCIIAGYISFISYFLIIEISQIHSIQYLFEINYYKYLIENFISRIYPYLFALTVIPWLSSMIAKAFQEAKVLHEFSAKTTEYEYKIQANNFGKTILLADDSIIGILKNPFSMKQINAKTIELQNKEHIELSRTNFTYKSTAHITLTIQGNTKYEFDIKNSDKTYILSALSFAIAACPISFSVFIFELPTKQLIAIKLGVIFEISLIAGYFVSKKCCEYLESRESNNPTDR